MRFSKISKRGFTLLEIIIVIIILAVLATLALPSFFSAVESSRGNEALTAITTLRGSIERCNMKNQGYLGCETMSNLDVPDPGALGQAHFTYSVTTATGSVYTVIATRKTVRGGSTGSTITYVVSPTGVVKSGTSAFSSIQ